jgi:hypothetical protein
MDRFTTPTCEGWLGTEYEQWLDSAVLPARDPEAGKSLRDSRPHQPRPPISPPYQPTDLRLFWSRAYRCYCYYLLSPLAGRLFMGRTWAMALESLAAFNAGIADAGKAVARA